MKSLSGRAAQKWLVAAGVLVAVLAIGGGVALHMSRTAAAEKADREHAAARASFTSDEDNTKPLKIGSVAKLGPDLSVAITKVSLYKGTTRQFIVVTVKAKNTGLTKSDPRTDLVVGFARVGSPTSGESTCEVDLGKLTDTQKISLAAGAAKTYAVCINIPTNKIKDGNISVLSNSTGARAAWSTTAAVTKKLDEPDAEVHVALPANQVPGTADYSKNLKKIKKAIKKNKKYRDQLDKAIDAYKALPDHKGKKLKKLKKQRDNIDDAIDQLEALQKQLER